jgi:hypothetical protein
MPPLGEDQAPSASSASGAESSRPPRPPPHSRPGPPGQHVRAGWLQLSLASTFGPAQFNPAAALWGRGLDARGWGIEVAKVAAAPPRARTRRRPRGGAATKSLGAGCLFWVWPAPPSSSRQWGACSQLGARVSQCACALVWRPRPLFRSGVSSRPPVAGKGSLRPGLHEAWASAPGERTPYDTPREHLKGWAWVSGTLLRPVASLNCMRCAFVSEYKKRASQESKPLCHC